MKKRIKPRQRERKDKAERKMSITKLGLFVNTGVALVLTALCILLSLYTDKYIDTLVSLTLGWLAENGVYTAFYIWKKKNDGRNKYAQEWVDKLAETYGIEAAARFAEIVLKGD